MTRGSTIVTKFSPEGQILWSTYLGGSGGDDGASIAIDSAGNIYVGGVTDSADFPVLNAWDSTQAVTCYNGQCRQAADGFLAKFSLAGTLLWSTYFGGDYYQPPSWWENDAVYNDFAYNVGNYPVVGGNIISRIAVDSVGNVYVTGSTWANDFLMLNAWDPSFSRLCYRWSGSFAGWCEVSNADALVAKFNTQGQPLWSTYLGGFDHDSSAGIAIDGAGNVYVAGSTTHFYWPGATSSDIITHQDSFPTLNAFDAIFGGDSNALNDLTNGNSDAFVTKFSPGGQLLWSTYLGGSFDDLASSIAVDGTGNVYA